MWRSCLIVVLLVFGFGHSAQSLRYFFGNLHAHTGFSDGCKDSLSTGITSPAGAYAYAKHSQHIDFLGISEHNHFSTQNNPGFLRPFYQRGLHMADSANENGNFLALFGMEYGVSSNFNGHVLVYGIPQLLGWENSVPGLSGANYDVFNARSDYDALFKRVARTPGAFAFLAHPGFSDFSSTGETATALAFGPYQASYDSAIVGMPLRSGLAFSTADNYEDYPQSHYFNYYKRLLYQGYHLGIGYDHDNHYSNFGRSNGGRMAVICEGLNRTSFQQAIQNMHFYGSDDSNAQIQFNLDNAMMGSIVDGSVFPTFYIQHNDPDGEQVDTIKIWKGHANSGGLWADIVYTALQTNTAAFTDTDVQTGIEYYYFAEIKQKDGQWIVTSPIWFTGKAPLELPQHQARELVMVFPNPVGRQLQLHSGSMGVMEIQIRNQEGVVLLKQKVNGPHYTLDVSELKKGLYVMELSTEYGTQFQKLVKE